MPTALVIDADVRATSTIVAALQPRGVVVSTASDPTQAIEQVRTAPPDIVLLRVELPTLSGFAVCNSLRRDPVTKSVPLVMYASDVAPDVFVQHRTLRTGADAYLAMPLQPRALLAAVGRLIALGGPH